MSAVRSVTNRELHLASIKATQYTADMSSIEEATAWNRGIPCKILKLLIKPYMLLFFCYIRVTNNGGSYCWFNWTKIFYPSWLKLSFYTIRQHRFFLCYNNTIRQQQKDWSKHKSRYELQKEPNTPKGEAKSALQKYQTPQRSQK